MIELGPQQRATLLDLARRAIREYLERDTLLFFPTEDKALLRPGAAFVTLRDKHTSELRGCRGEVRARRPLVESVIEEAVSSATDDPRFTPVSLEEVEDLSIQISVVSPMKRIRPQEVELGRHGLMIVRGDHSGLLLPQVATHHRMKTAKEFLEATCRKASLPLDSWSHPGTTIYGFQTVCWGDEDALD